MTPSPKYSYIFSKKDYVGEKMSSIKFMNHQSVISNEDNRFRSDDLAKLPIHIIKEKEGMEYLYNQLGDSELKFLLPSKDKKCIDEMPRKNRRGK